jgi:Protein of unknown function (DUF2721)
MPPLDVAKIVGAASAPVALIIATSIFLSNLGAKYAMLAGTFRELTNELRETEEKDRGSLRAKSVHRSLKMYAHRLRVLIRATFWLTISILCFIFTVVFTGIGVIFTDSKVWQIITVAFSFAGLLILAGSVGFEIWENHQAKLGLILETSDFPDIVPGELQDGKEAFRKEHAEERRRNAA